MEREYRTGKYEIWNTKKWTFISGTLYGRSLQIGSNCFRMQDGTGPKLGYVPTQVEFLAEHADR